MTNSLGRKRILVVDDSEKFAKMIGMMLEMVFGQEVHLAFDGATAIATAKKFLPDLILMDIGMPGMNGYEVCQAMRQEPLLKNTMIVAQTGWGQKEHFQRSKEVGFDRHLVKPVSVDTLREVLCALTSRIENSSIDTIELSKVIG